MSYLQNDKFLNSLYTSFTYFFIDVRLLFLLFSRTLVVIIYTLHFFLTIYDWIEIFLKEMFFFFETPIFEQFIFTLICKVFILRSTRSLNLSFVEYSDGI